MPTPDALLLAELAGCLRATASGELFVRDALGRLADHARLQEVVLVVEDAPRGRRAFTRSSSAVDTLTRTPFHAGIYTDPVLLDDTLQEAVRQLCLVALELDSARHEAGHDSLTGLANRRAFDIALDHACARSARYGWEFTLALVDLDRFKQLNDRLGHSQGDEVLSEVGEAMQASLRAGDVAARVGGDEFALVLEGSGVNAVAAVVHRLDRRLRARPIEVGVGFSVGVAFAPQDACEPAELYRLADRRLYEAKAS